MFVTKKACGLRFLTCSLCFLPSRDRALCMLVSNHSGEKSGFSMGASGKKSWKLHIAEFNPWSIVANCHDQLGMLQYGKRRKPNMLSNVAFSRNCFLDSVPT